MQKIMLWIKSLIGNNLKASILILVFILLLLAVAFRAHAQGPPQVHLLGGVSFGCLAGGPVLGLELQKPIAEGLSVTVGTTLWGAASGIRNNWDWHVRAEFSRDSFGAAIGPSYLQNIDGANGSHAEMSLMLFWRPRRVGAAVIHLSNAGTTASNCGRNAGMMDWRVR